MYIYEMHVKSVFIFIILTWMVSNLFFILLSQNDSRISVQLITEECVHKLDTKHQTNALLNLVWRDSASEEVFTMMASICHTLMVQHRLMVPKVRYWDAKWVLEENDDGLFLVNSSVRKFEHIEISVKTTLLNLKL